MRLLALFALALVFLAGTEPALAQNTLATGAAPEIPWLRLILSFALCIGLAAAAIFLLKHYQARRAGVASGFGGLQFAKGASRFQPELQVVEARRMVGNSHVCLVQFDGRQFLLAVSDGGTSIVHERPIPEVLPEDAVP